MAKTTRYGVEVVWNGETLYYQRGVHSPSYVLLEGASATTDFAELGRWEEYVKNDVANGSVTSYQLVEIELKASPAPGLDNEIKDAVIAEARAKLTQLERDVLGI